MNRNISPLKNNHGQYLLESLGALSILIFLLIALQQIHFALERRKNAIETHRNQQIQAIQKQSALF